jgi:hypothetical protein
MLGSGPAGGKQYMYGHNIIVNVINEGDFLLNSKKKINNNNNKTKKQSQNKF